jgi:hypothetical protein
MPDYNDATAAGIIIVAIVFAAYLFPIMAGFF